MIVGFSISQMQAEGGEGKGQGDVQVNYSPELKGVSDKKVAAFEDKIAAIDFSFTISYRRDKKEFANISLAGQVLWKGDVEHLLATWQEKETLPAEMYESFMNNLYRRCLTRAVSTAETLNLPSPIPMPRIRKKSK